MATTTLVKIDCRDTEEVTRAGVDDHTLKFPLRIPSVGKT